jgi:hypothetical protein
MLQRLAGRAPVAVSLGIVGSSRSAGLFWDRRLNQQVAGLRNEEIEMAQLQDWRVGLK